MVQLRRIAAALTGVALATSALGLAGCAADESKASDKGDIKIGVSLEESGPTQSIGTAYKKALQLKVADINRKGILGGRKLKLIFKDNQTDPKQNITNVNGFISNDKVDAMITGACSACDVPVTSISDKKKIPTIALASASNVTEPVSQRQYTFKVSPTPGQDAKVLMEYLKKKGVRSIGLLNVDNPYGQGGRKAVTAEGKSLGIKIVSAQQFEQTDKDMSVQVKKISEAKPQAIVVWAVMPAAGQIAKNIKDSSYKGGVYLDAGAGAELFVKGAASASEGTHMVFAQELAINDVTSTTPQVSAQKKWFQEYSSKYGTYSGFASFAADGLQMLATAMEQAHGTDKVAVRNKLETLGIDGLSGRIQDSAGNHSGLQASALAVLEVRNGEWHLAT